MLGKYERLDVLGHGVSGIVYLARDTLLNKQVALKEVDVQAGDVRRFLEEARVMDRLNHPNIVHVNGVDRIDGKIVIDMEFVRGENLQDLLRRETSVPLDRALGIAEQVLDALDYAHRMQTIHRDIKPANILIGRDGSVKLVDFGLAEILTTNAYAGGAGTYAYMAPEDFAEEDHSDSRSDIWSVGVTLYEMLCAQRPFHVDRVKDPFSWKRALETTDPTPIADYLPGAPAALQTVFDRALARDKERRYAAACDFRADLLALRSALAGTADSALCLVHPDAPAVRRIPVETQDPVASSRPADLVVDSAVVVDSGRPEPGAVSQRDPLASRPAAPRDGLPGTVVADIGAEARPARTPPQEDEPPHPPAGSRRRRQQEPTVRVSPGAVDFGVLRKGDMRQTKLQARIDGAQGPVAGRISCDADWIAATPARFNRRRLSIRLIADSERTWETGDFETSLRVETNVGSREVPIRLRVTPARASFRQIVLWYLPLLVAALLPAAAVAQKAAAHADPALLGMLKPTATLASALLMAMLFLVTAGADLGIAERIFSGLFSVVLCILLGVQLGAQMSPALQHILIPRMLVVGGLLGSALLLQLGYLTHWKLWAILLGSLGLCAGVGFYYAV
jgi:serine/threonine-protein kinase